MSDERDHLGRIVREAWMKWARTQPDPKPSWLVPYDDLSEPDKEADRQIAEAVLGNLNARRIYLAEKKNLVGLELYEVAEFAALQEGYFASLEVKHPSPPSQVDRIEAIERRLRLAASLDRPMVETAEEVL